MIYYRRWKREQTGGRTEPRRLRAAEAMAFATFLLTDSQLEPLARLPAQENRNVAGGDGRQHMSSSFPSRPSHPRLIPNLHKLWRLPPLPRDSVMSAASPGFQMSTADLDKTKEHERSGTHGGGSFVLAGFACVRWRGMVHHAPETLSKQSNKIDGGYSFLHVFIRWWNT